MPPKRTKTTRKRKPRVKSVRAKNIVHVKNIIKMGDSGQTKAASGGAAQPSPVMPITWKPAEFDYPSLAKTAAGMKQIQEEVLKQPGKPAMPTAGVMKPPGDPKRKKEDLVKDVVADGLLSEKKARKKKIPELQQLLGLAKAQIEDDEMMAERQLDFNVI